MLEIIKLMKQPKDLSELANDLKAQGKEAISIDLFKLGEQYFAFVFVG